MRTRLSLLVLFVVLFCLSFQLQRSLVLNAVAPADAKFFDNFHPAVAAMPVRWSRARSAIWLNGLGGGNLSGRIGLRLSGPRPSGFVAPRVTVRLNAVTLSEFTATDEAHDFEWIVKPWQLGANGDVLLEIESEVFKPASNAQDLGICVSTVWLARDRGFALPSPRIFLLLIGLSASCAFLARMTTRGRMLLRWSVPLGVAALVILGLTINRAQTNWWLGVASISAVLFAATVCLLRRIIGRATELSRQRWILFLVFAFAALLRLGLDLGKGYDVDVAVYLSLAWKVAHFGIQNAYLAVGEVPPSDNPPFLLYPFWFFGSCYQHFISPLFPPSWIVHPVGLRFMLRLPSLVADLIIGALIFRTLDRDKNLGFNTCVLAASAYLFNPAIIIDSAYWGQTAAIHSLFMLLALVATAQRTFARAGASLAAAILTKPQALAIAPLVAMVAWKERGALRFLAGGASVALLLVSPFIFGGSIGNVIGQYTHTADYHPFLTMNAHNFWWLVSGGESGRPDDVPFVWITYRRIGLLMFGAAAFVALLAVWRDSQQLFWGAAYLSLAFFMLNTQIHENHLLPMFAPLVLAVSLSGELRWWWLYLAFAITTSANMLLHDPALLTSLGYNLEQMINGTAALSSARWFNSLMQTFLFLVFTWRFVRPLIHDLVNRFRPTIAQQ